MEPDNTTVADALLLDKIQVLLKTQHVECTWVALTLLTRVHSDVFFVETILQQTQFLNLNFSSMARLTAQLFHRLVVSPHRKTTIASGNNDTMDELGNALVGHLVGKNNWIATRDSFEILLSLRAWLGEGTSDGTCGKVLERLVQVAIPPAVETRTTNNEESKHDQATTDQTLTALLEQTSFVEENGEFDLEEQQREFVVDMFLQFGKGNTQLPRFLSPLLAAWMDETSATKKQKRNKLLWARVILVTVRLWAEQQQGAVAEQETSLAGIVHVVLACITFHNSSPKTPKIPNTSADELRATAWSTVSALVSKSQWNWIFVVHTPPKAMGNAAQLCALLRMAAGEYKIQLGIVVDANDSGRNADETVALVQSCANVLIHAVDYLAMTDTRHVAALTGDAIFHIRTSLEQSWKVCLEYFVTMMHKEPKDDATTYTDSSVLQVMAVLMVEFDNDVLQKDETLLALQHALLLPNAHLLFPSLATILDAANNPSLNQNVTTALLSCLERAFEENKDELTIQWACRLTELVFAGKLDTTGRLRERMFSYLEASIASTIQPETISAVIGCYAMLQDDRVPTKVEESILQKCFVKYG